MTKYLNLRFLISEATVDITRGKNAPETVEQMHKHLRDAKEAEKNLKSNKPKILAFLPLIACHFKEMNLDTFIVSIMTRLSTT